jgi:DNA-binding response OmpR family regulator
MLNIAVVEDNDDLRAAIMAALSLEGHHVAGFDCAEALVEQSQILWIDLMVVDLNLPGEDGLALTRRIRGIQPQIGIIMVTARTRTLDKQIGYESGADIYLTKPVSLDELRAAIHALERRLAPTQGVPSALVLDGRTLTLRGAMGEVSLSAQEAALLSAFSRASDQRLETWQILEIVDRTERTSSRGTLNVMIFRLSRKLRQAGSGDRPIRAIRGWGYQLCETVLLG